MSNIQLPSHRLAMDRKTRIANTAYGNLLALNKIFDSPELLAAQEICRKLSRGYVPYQRELAKEVA